MNNNLKIGILFAVLLVGAIVLLRLPSKLNQNDNLGAVGRGPAVLTAEQASFDFGTISMAKGVVSHSFSFKNTSLQPVTINKVYTSCMCTTAYLIHQQNKFGPFGMPGHGLGAYISETISPGEQVSLQAFFDPAAHGPAGIGNIQRQIYLENNAGSPLIFSFTATVTP